MTAAVTEHGPLLYKIPEACALLRMSRTEIYEQIKAGRLHTIHQGCAALEQEIARRLALQPAVVVLSRAGLARVIADNPFPWKTSPRCLHAVFRREEMTADAIAAIAAAQRSARARGSRDEAVVVGRRLFLRTPDGIGRSELAVQLARFSGQAAGTARNWATVTRLMAMLGPAA
jgi:uncharacterized protein (DUF1697 family)